MVFPLVIKCQAGAGAGKCPPGKALQPGAFRAPTSTNLFTQTHIPQKSNDNVIYIHQVAKYTGVL